MDWRLDFEQDGDIDSSDSGALYYGPESIAELYGYDGYRQVTASRDNRFGFAGYTWDPYVGVYFVRNRVYDPARGRWLQRDPSLYHDGFNLYEYCHGDPIGFIDPMGLWGEETATKWANSGGTLMYAAGWTLGVVGGFEEGLAHGWVIATDELTFHKVDPLHKAADQLVTDGGDWYAAGRAADVVARNAALAAGGGIAAGGLAAGVTAGSTAEAGLLAAGNLLQATGLVLGAHNTGTGIGELLEGDFRNGIYDLADGSSMLLFSVNWPYQRYVVGTADEAGAGGAAGKQLSTTRLTQPGETYYHYGYADQAGNFEGGIRPGGFATTDPNFSAGEAQSGLNLRPGEPRNVVYPVRPEPGTMIIGPKPVEGGWGQEVIFPRGTGPGTVGPPTTVPCKP